MANYDRWRNFLISLPHFKILACSSFERIGWNLPDHMLTDFIISARSN